MKAREIELQSKAFEFRITHGIGVCEPIRLKSWLPKLGIICIFKPLSEKFSGMAIKQDNQKFIIINSNHSLGKQHFTAAHEIYHLFIQEDFVSEVSHAGKFDSKDKIEYEADIFGAFLLMPNECIFALIPSEERKKNKITIETIVKIEQYFACSRTALVFRLEQLGLIDHHLNNTFTSNIMASALRLGYDDRQYRAGNENLVIGDYGSKAKKLFDKGLISESHYIDLMNVIGVDISNITDIDEQEYK